LEAGKGPEGIRSANVIIGNVHQLYEGKDNWRVVAANCDSLCIYNDEAHNTRAEQYNELINRLKPKRFFRLDTTATPDRLDGLHPDSEMIYVYDIAKAMREKVIKRVVVFDTDSKQAFAASNFLLRLRPKVDIDPHFLAFVLGSPPTREAVADSVKTMTYPNLSFRIYSTIEVPVIPLADQKLVGAFFQALLNKQPLPALPRYLAEQRRVVARIEELAAQIAEARSLRYQAAEEAEALTHSTVSKLAYGTAWETKRLPEVAQINPSRAGNVKLAANDMASFVPMKAVDDVTGTIAWPETRPFHEISKGYTWFTNGDIIFARITPCMQNGKAALAKNLVNGVAFGSTEFHVIRPGKDVCAEWLYHLVRHKTFRDNAAEHFKGTAGQQRVPQSFLEEKLIPVPPLPEQRRIVAELDALQAEVGALKRLQAETAAEFAALLPSILDRAFKGEL
jgi:restriction endonuclease S subunit